MNAGKTTLGVWIIIGSAAAILFLTGFGVVFAFAAMGSLTRENHGYTGGGSGGYTGTLTGNIPTPLANVFTEVGQTVGVPPAFLAATSSIECGGLWSVDEGTLTNWINNNGDVDQRGCYYNNGYWVYGPMQFLDTTWGGDIMKTNRAVRGSKEPPRIAPASGTPGQAAGQGSNHQPPIIVNIKDAAYAAAYKHLWTKKANFGDSATWTDDVIRTVARIYCNGGTNTADNPTTACRIKVNNQWVGYGAGALDRYKKYSGQLSGGP